MALPVGPQPKSRDVAVHGWAGITVRAAWTLLSLGVKVRPEVLRAARTHALLQIAATATLPEAEDQVESHTRAFVARAKGSRADERWTADAAMPPSPRWRRALERSLSPVAEVIFRKHFGDNRPLGALAARMGVEVWTLQTAVAGLREVVRRAAARDNIPISTWTDDRVDRLLGRLAAWSPGPCPPMLDVIDGGHTAHLRGCCRCDRMQRLVRHGILTVEDLYAPSLGVRPEEPVTVLGLHIHPEATAHRDVLKRALGERAFAAGEDFLLVDASDMEPVTRAIVLAAELATPERDQIRGALLTGSGSWTKYGLLGGLGEQVEAAARFRTWGVIEGVGELPAPLPAPPPARPYWIAVAALAAVTSILVSQIVPAAVNPAAFPIDAEFVAGRGGWWVDFDVDDRAYLSIVRDHPGEPLDVVLRSEEPAEKADFAIGDGRYRLHAVGEDLLVVSTTLPLSDLESLAAQQRGQDRLALLATAVREASPDADLRRARP
jgi:hypothetical protein